ncbi:hypothetical protein NPIL_629391 [Nephila pilipes]|uniref:Uncharacterized protein n=1 Tax=Nephila pilipes TaxID=299642 RepID=A0A8X6TMN9_NEPPI|nr:hypothetical protein NPIL_629391 [Nephila pilipes]
MSLSIGKESGRVGEATGSGIQFREGEATERNVWRQARLCLLESLCSRCSAMLRRRTEQVSLPGVPCLTDVAFIH